LGELFKDHHCILPIIDNIDSDENYRFLANAAFLG
jgi:hypothetical protein